MPPSRPAAPKAAARSAKLDLRLTPTAKRTLLAASRARQKSVSEFVLDSALTAAADVLAEQRTIRLNAEQWSAFLAALDAPAQRHSRLERLLREPGVFD